MKFGAEQQVAQMGQDMREQKIASDAAMHSQAKEHEERELEMSRKEHDGMMKLTGERADFEENRASYAKDSADRQERDTKSRDDALASLVQEVSKQNAETQAALADLVKAINKPKRLIRNPQTGRAEGMETMR